MWKCVWHTSYTTAVSLGAVGCPLWNSMTHCLTDCQLSSVGVSLTQHKLAVDVCANTALMQHGGKECLPAVDDVS